MQRKYVYVISNFYDWNNEHDTVTWSAHTDLESAKKDADQKLEDDIHYYSQHNFPRESLNVEDWVEDLNSQIRPIYANSAKGAAKNGLVGYQKIERIQLEN